MDDKPSTAVMASEVDSDVTKLKGTKILVFVEDSLFDVLVVSFHSGSKIFQGALLDITKKNSPYGIVSPPSLDSQESAAKEKTSIECGIEEADEKLDKFHALKQRHTYFQVAPGATPLIFGPRQFSRNAKDKSVRMRRLRPRKVLCSHCEGIFNENDVHQRKGAGATKRSNVNNRNIQCGDKSVLNNNNTGKLTICGTRLNRTVYNNTEKSYEEEKKVSEVSSSVVSDSCETADIGAEAEEKKSVDELNMRSKNGNQQSDRMVLRKRKISNPDHIQQPKSTEKLKKTDVVNVEDIPLNNQADSNNVMSVKSVLAKTSPVIKISFANPQGKDTVLKIPPRIQTISDTEEDSSWSLQENSSYSAKKFASAKAAKKALKKAKKEAQRKATVSFLHQNIENGERTLTSDKDKHHHHKHKVKRKRKHKNGADCDDKYNLENTDTRNLFKSGNNEGWSLRASFSDEMDILPNECGKPPSVYDDVKSKCLHQKLSISLKRLNAKAYMRCSPKYSIEDDSIVSDISDASSVSTGSGSGSDYGDVPDFPKHSSPLRDMDKVKPLMMRISTHNVKKCMLDSGKEMTVGDVVWGKIHGFPWWPGKVLALTVSQRDNGATINQQAHVSWFGSSTSSYMPCNQLTSFLDDFKMRYNKKKRGPYKEAIRQATIEAQKLPHKNLSELGIII